MTTANISDSEVVRATRASDGLENVLTGQGGRMDSRQHGARAFRYRRIGHQELQEAYRDNWLVGQVVDIPAFEMTRARRVIEDDPKVVKMIEKEEKRLKYWQKVREAIQWSDLFGGGALLLGVDGHGELDEPLDPEAIKPGQLRWVHSLDSRSLFPFASQHTQLSYDPTSEQFLEPEFYTLAAARVDKIHHSRIVKFHGLSLPWLEMVRTLWWGGSRVERMFSALADAEQVIGGTADLVTEAKIDVIGVKDLMQILSTDDGEALLRKRLELVNMSKSIYHAVIMDAEENYQQKTNTIAQGMPSLVEQFLAIVSAASGIPVTRLLGTSAKGLNATGEGDLTNWYDTVDARRVNYVEPRLTALDSVMFRSLGISDPTDIDWEFGNLWQLSESDQATVDKTRAETDDIHLRNGVIDEVIVVKRLQEEGTYPAIDDAFVKEIEEMVDEPEPDPLAVPAAGSQPTMPRPQLAPVPATRAA